MTKRGFSLLECLISLSLFFFVVAGALESFVAARKAFFKLKDSETGAQAALAALDKTRIDLLHAGRGLVIPHSLGILEPVSCGGDWIACLRTGTVLSPAGDLVSGQTRITIPGAADLDPGREIVLFDAAKGEVGLVEAVLGEDIILSTPLRNAYVSETTTLVLIETVRVFMDADGRTLRRQANRSPAQPLCENVRSFLVSPEADARLVTIILSLRSQEEKEYGITVFPKNPGLAAGR